MDPISVLSLVEACAGLGVTAGKLAIGLKSLADNYKAAALAFRSLSSQCKLFATAVRAIQAWMEDAPDMASVDERIFYQLSDSLECANDAIYALENELVSTSKGTVNTFWEKVHVVWNIDNLKELQDCIHKQITRLGVILQIMNLPTAQSQTRQLQKQSSVFQESRSSAMSMRDAETSTLRAGGNAANTIRTPSTIITDMSQLPRFDFDEMLLTSQVYLRNRNKTLALHATSSKSGKMKDAEVSVNAWELPNKYSSHLDLRTGAELARNGSKEELVAFIDSHVLSRHEELQAKYSKVKRYYFEREAQILSLEKDIENLKNEDWKLGLPNHGITSLMEERDKLKDEVVNKERYIWELKYQITRSEAFLSSNEVKRLRVEVTELTGAMESLKQGHQKLQAQNDWYRIQLSYWNEDSPSAGNSGVSGSTAHSSASQQTMVMR